MTAGKSFSGWFLINLQRLFLNMQFMAALFSVFCATGGSFLRFNNCESDKTVPPDAEQ